MGFRVGSPDCRAWHFSAAFQANERYRHANVWAHREQDNQLYSTESCALHSLRFGAFRFAAEFAIADHGSLRRMVCLAGKFYSNSCSLVHSTSRCMGTRHAHMDVFQSAFADVPLPFWAVFQASVALPACCTAVHPLWMLDLPALKHCTCSVLSCASASPYRLSLRSTLASTLLC